MMTARGIRCGRAFSSLLVTGPGSRTSSSWRMGSWATAPGLWKDMRLLEGNLFCLMTGWLFLSMERSVVKGQTCEHMSVCGGVSEMVYNCNSLKCNKIS